MGPDGPTGLSISAWTLNVSRGGVRLVVEEVFEEGEEVQLSQPDNPQASSRRARIVWLHAETDGQIIGAQFLDVDGSVPPPDPNSVSS